MHSLLSLAVKRRPRRGKGEELQRRTGSPGPLGWGTPETELNS